LATKQHLHLHRRLLSSLSQDKQEDHIVERWLAERLEDKLKKYLPVLRQTHKPILLYRNTIEENEAALREQVALIIGRQIIIFVYTYGGFVPTTFDRADVYTLDKFTKWIVKKGKKDLLLQCLENINNIK
jgi:hypothetical protein